MPAVEVESDEDDDFFDALETFQASTYQKSVAKPRAQSRIPQLSEITEEEKKVEEESKDPVA